ncbi:AAA family ATPase [Mycobacterium sp. pUA109]|uniref:AAA family ATPase n=1 Tax=Mycobacterium sp. pUA109 TaxID=3238982 RepID=UPI00351B861E
MATAQVGGIRAFRAELDPQSAEFVDAVTAGLHGHPARMQQMLGRVLRRPPTALTTNPALLESLLAVVSTITAPAEPAAVRDDGSLSQWSGPRRVPGQRFILPQTEPDLELPDSLTWDSVDPVDPVLDPPVHRLLTAVIEEYRSESLKTLGIPATRTLLLTGDPGTGKTMTARWIAAQLGRPLLRLDLAAVMNKQLGRSSQNLVAALETAADTDAVLFIDEFDAVGSARSSSSDIGEVRRLVNVLLLALESWPENHLLIGATNHPQLLDAAVHRRFEVTVRLPKPGRAAREQIWQSLVPSLSDADAAILASMSNDWSGSDIATYALRIRRAAGMQNRAPKFDDVLELFSQNGLDCADQPGVIEALAGRGYSQRKIASVVGVSHTTVQNKIKNRR